MLRMKSLLLLISVLITTGCSSFNQTQSNRAQMGNILLAEPEQVSERSQIWLARLNHVLGQVQQIPDDQRAELLYQRGMLYDGFGLWGLARADFDAALQLKPDMAEAFNFLGIHYTQNQEFIQAYDAFDSTLDIDPEHEFAFLNRGIALYYGGRPELSIRDLETFYQGDLKDPFRALWLYIVESAVDEAAAQQRLAAIRGELDNSRWEMNIVSLYLGEINEFELLDRLMMDIYSHQQLTRRLCEVYFYLGKYHTAKGREAEASNYFKLSLSTNVYQYVEHRYARLELEIMRERTVLD